MHVATSVQMAQPSPFLVLHLLAPLLSRMPEVLIRTLPPPCISASSSPPPLPRLPQVLIRSRIHNVRGKGKSAFLVLRQRTATVQVRHPLPTCQPAYGCMR